MHVDTIRLDEVMLGNSPEITVSYTKEAEGIEITRVTLGNTDIMDYLDEVTLQTLVEELDL